MVANEETALQWARSAQVDESSGHGFVSPSSAEALGLSGGTARSWPDIAHGDGNMEDEMTINDATDFWQAVEEAGYLIEGESEDYARDKMPHS